MIPPKVVDRPIAWVCRTYEQNGKTELTVEREGMSRAEILALFPPGKNPGGIDFSRKDLIKAIIYEAYTEALQSDKERPRQNIRGFWYERIFYTLISVMGEKGDADNIASIDTSINAAWKDLIEDGFVTYTALNLYSEKESNYRISVREDSPYPTAIVMVEKASLYDALNDLANTYEISFCCTGGHNSRAAAMEYAAELERQGIDLAQDFTIFSFCDFDPEGWSMPEVFLQHLALKVSGEINIVRLGVLKEQLGQSVIDRQAIPYSLEARTKGAKKAKETKYANFAEATGGLYIPDGTGQLIPARVELNIYNDEQVREKIITGLAKYLDGFPYQIRTFKESISVQYHSAWDEIVGNIRQEIDRLYGPYYEQIERARSDLSREESRRALSEKQRIQELNEMIVQLNEMITEQTTDIRQKREKLKNLENALDEYREADVQSAIEGLSYYTPPPGPDDLISEVELNGGWRHWAGELSIEAKSGDDLARAARQHAIFNANLDFESRYSIREWIQEKIEKVVDYYDVSIQIVQSPDEIVTETLSD